MHKTMRSLEDSGATIVYTDCDSIYFKCKKAHEKKILDSISIGHLPNQFKNEYPNCEILEFYCLGPKQTCLSYNDADKKKQTDIKFSGINFKATCVDPVSPVTVNTFKEFIRTLDLKEKNYKKIVQVINRKQKGLDTFLPRLEYKTISNTFTAKRKRLEKGRTIPFGFKEAKRRHRTRRHLTT